ncbi:MAG: aminotransferase class III-fold pyridoxal phosphate-dependent enzyme [Burkholderiaceae bacterium]|nr:aminotransferase class III-fold pyridoxal phosphate-dependent enzyme [Burkholderiaceae bacterium]MCD8515778.1 aminotransferase class III-fold pyridoxal phosphate-dependent enzyme [Burkholderiaceae bacterium]MCD8565470.1 aminotransferase class III-fold pyridoxal phosphate-dependent enzyme [Burkholderiaceae bacterium]
MWLEWSVGAGLTAWLAPKAWRRAQLSRAKHRSLAGHSRMAKRLARLLPEYHYTDAEFFVADGAPDEVATQRRQGFMRLAESFAQSPQTLALTRQTREQISDMQLTGRNRVPFQFSPLVQQHLPIGAFWQSSNGVCIKDLDGREFIDLTGSYGVNVMGLDFYKDTMRTGLEQSLELGPLLGGYLPCVATNASRLLQISGMDEVSFHMSGTEAVMQAVRLARYHTGRRKIVRFAGAYHGWWDDVQPGPGNPMPPGHVYTLADMSQKSLEVIRRRKDIACVLVNPLQSLHPNVNAPADTTLIDGSRRIEPASRDAYSEWLKQLRQACDANGVALILDEVFVGFRLALGGAQAYFDVKADLVCYGKTLAGGFPIGAVCGKSAWMRRFRPGKAADICFARGTFNAHPTVMAAMSAFLDQATSEACRERYEAQQDLWDRRVTMFNEAFEQAGYPVRFHNLQSIWTVSYKSPSRYHWMYQFYLRDEGLALSWVGTGRFIFSLNFTDTGMQDVLDRMLRAAARMQADGWWWHEPGTTTRDLRRGVTREIGRQWLKPLRMLVSSNSPLSK